MWRANCAHCSRVTRLNAMRANGLVIGRHVCYGRKRRWSPTNFSAPAVLLISPMLSAIELKSLNERFNSQPTEEILRWAWERFGTRAGIGTSFQGAGLV